MVFLWYRIEVMKNPFGQPNSFEETNIIPDRVLEQARALSDNATANGRPMNFDTGLEHASALHEANKLAVIPLFEDDRSLRDMKSTEFFQLAEALDIVMHYDPDETRRYNGAALVVDLHSSLQDLSVVDVDARTRILEGVLKIDSASPVAPQLAERYFSAGTDLEREVVAEVIQGRSRVVSR